MPIDRALTLRNAEKLIRQGKLDAGIAEYLRIVEDTPGDWNAKNTLGDLYARAGQTEKAIEQFTEIADNLSDEGASAKAGAIYKKILKLKPDHERALMQVAEILANQKLYADARTHLNTLIELRKGKGDTRGALHAKVRLGSLDPEDYDARLESARARVEMGDKAGALRDLKEIAAELAVDKGRQAQAIDVLREAGTLNPDDHEVKEQLFDIYLAGGELLRAREHATSVEQFRSVASAFEAQGNTDEALETLRSAVALNDEDTELKAELARAFVAKGDLETAAQYLTVETAGDDPELLLTVAEMRLRGEAESVEEGLSIARRLIEQDRTRRDRVAQLGWTIAEHSPEAGFKAVELAADTAVSENDWGAAAAALQEFVTRVPNHIPALMRLVEICVDGGLEATMYSAQSQLADAYIAAGAATEALFIAEDLVAREPWDSSNIERFRRALELSGEPDPDALIASRLSGESPFTSTDLLLAGDPQLFEPPVEAKTDEEPGLEIDVEPVVEEPVVEEPKVKKPPKAQPKRHPLEAHQFQLSANAIDLESILGDLDAPAASPAAHTETETENESEVELDLSLMLEDSATPPPPKKSGTGG